MAYIYWLCVFVWTPLLVLWALHWRYLARYLHTFLRCILWSLVFGVAWDLLGVKRGIWFFPQGGNLGFNIGILPFEEYLFIIFVSILVSTVALLFRKKFLKQ